MLTKSVPAIRSKLGNVGKVERLLNSLVGTFDLSQPIPSLTQHECITILLVLLEVLTVKDSDLRQKLHSDNKQALHKMLSHFQIDQDEWKELVNIFSESM